MSINTVTKFPTCEMPFTGIETLLRLIYTELCKQNAIDGIEMVDAGDTYNDTDMVGFVVREDTVIGMLRIGVDDVRDDYEIVAKTLLVTDPAIMAPGDKPFTSITVTSGSVWVLKKL